MIGIIYIVIISYFLLGALGFYLINRKKAKAQARKNWIKFGTYFIIIHILFFSIVLGPVFFRYLSLLIIGIGLFELVTLYRKEGYKSSGFFVVSLLLFAFFSVGLFLFSGMNRELILFSFLILSIFDSFSQISGQLFGKKKLFPAISPNKTLEGLIGGALVAVFSTFLLQQLTGMNNVKSLLLATGIVVFAFAGDILASLYKRKYKAKDFSRLIPGHGGFLDRFDSLMAAGTWVSLSYLLAIY